MPESFDDLKSRFHKAVDEFIEAICAHRDAHAEAILTESAELDQRYLAALENRD